MGGTKILAAAINSRQGIIARVKKSTKSGSTPNQYLNNLVDIIQEISNKLHFGKTNIKGICIGIPGSVNTNTGWVGIAPNLGIKNFHLKTRLQKLIPFPIVIENDVNLGALGIKHYGVGVNAKNMIAVFIGTGIGGGIIFNEKIYRGSNFVAGEIGHMIVEKNGPKCGCGNKGCFEAVASRTAIVRNILKDIESGKKSYLSKFAARKEKIKSGAIKQAIKSGDKVTITRISEGCETIGTTLAGVSNLLNLDMIVLGGGLVEALSGFMLPKIKESFYNVVMKDSAKDLKILASKLGDDAALYGGLALAEEFLNVKV